ncbi:MAG: putative toxin-antitoxin system toxin component, PIN family [Schwartzia sp.]|nr:putative toxin-antitoxin system toxin component, PIN family [Schwartzia sp. (in: firmicutes)]
MRVLIDTNVLISAALNPNGVPAAAYRKAASYPHHGMVCEQNLDELRRIFHRKFPGKLPALEQFLSVALTTLELVSVPKEEIALETKIRDAGDRPILRAAVKAEADVLLTGDKDFLDSGVDHPVMMTPGEFVQSDVAS